MSGRNCVCVSWYREEKSARGARAADVAERAPMRPGGPVQLTSKSQQINDDTVTRDACMNNDQYPVSLCPLPTICLLAYTVATGRKAH